MTRDIVIVGAGLSGLALADRMTRDGRDVVVLDARDRVGGRILSVPASSGTLPRFDMGPAWVWPHQRQMRALIARLGLSVMPQHAFGKLVFEDANGTVRRDLDFATMGDAMRVAGGLAQIPDALAAGLPATSLRLGHEVARIEMDAESAAIRLQGTAPDGPFQIDAHSVVIALPPRLAAGLAFAPALPAPLRQQMTGVATWMAGHGKVMAVYDTPFWRDAGLSGDAISHHGPLMEIHDATAQAGSETAEGAALFGFIHPNHMPQGADLDRFETLTLKQLGSLFGPSAASPTALHIKLWADDPYTATEADRTLPGAHPDYAPLDLTGSGWMGRLWLCSTETAAQEGGFLEGALIAAEATYRDIQIRHGG